MSKAGAKGAIAKFAARVDNNLVDKRRRDVELGFDRGLRFVMLWRGDAREAQHDPACPLLTQSFSLGIKANKESADDGR
jgi:hypothetical protein